MNDKEKIISQFKEIFDRWEALLAGLSEEQITAPNRVADLSIKDILAPLTAWQQVSLARMQAARQNREPEYPDWPSGLDMVHETNIDEINAWIHETYRQQPWPGIYQEWRERYLLILELAQAFPEKDFLEIGRYPWLEGYPISAVIMGSWDHHQEHIDDLVALARQDGKI